MINLPVIVALLCLLLGLTSVVLLAFSLTTRKRFLTLNQLTLDLWRIEKLILNTLDFNQVTFDVVNAALTELSKYGYVILVLSLIDHDKQIVKRVSISSTQEAKTALKYSPIPFNSIEIPLGAYQNAVIKSITENKPILTTNLYELLRPVVREQLALQAQQAAGIKMSIVYPLKVKGQVLGAMIYTATKSTKHLSKIESDLLISYTDLVGLAVQNSMLYTNLRNTKDSLVTMTDRVTRMNQKLQELDKLKDDFVSVASHELRTPMTAIRSYAWMALNRSDVPLTDKLQRYLNRILISTDRLINLVNDMLNVSRIESGRVEIAPQVFDITKLTADVIAEVEPKASEKNLHLSIVNTELPKVFADPDKVHQVLLNLLGNALKFTPAAGTISVSYLSDGQTVEIRIKDSGVGISQEDISRLFQKFGRLDNSYVASATSGGTGLGLYICKSLIELMKGRIWAESPGLGKGTTFAFTLPIANNAVLNQPQNYAHKVLREPKVLEPISL